MPSNSKGIPQAQTAPKQDRRIFWKLIPAFLVPMMAKGQENITIPPSSISLRVAEPPPPVPDYIDFGWSRWVVPEWLKRGNPMNNQCPVCSTMADPYKQPTQHINDGWRRLPDTDYVMQELNGRDVPVGPSMNVTRCLRCNCAFCQDAGGK